ncbi:Leucine-responsive regulatory protein [Collimonas arenae]|uniref:Leucine-responsive regulatory protein n=2 Tax=Collimonas arenae TaxID=279058 RepID=A0A0A1FDE8_9BURK|nr:Leucine-responsive regulatory protein [Collimonas arenae]
MPYYIRKYRQFPKESKMLNNIDQRILETLQSDARISLKELALQVGLSSPSVSERLQRLEERGVIRAFTIDIDPQALGYQLQAIVRIRPLPGKLQIVQKLIEQIPEFCECDKVTGEDCYIARLFVRSIAQLDEIIDRIADKAETNTAIVKSQPIKRRPPPFGIA